MTLASMLYPPERRYFCASCVLAQGAPKCPAHPEEGTLDLWHAEVERHLAESFEPRSSFWTGLHAVATPLLFVTFPTMPIWLYLLYLSSRRSAPWAAELAVGLFAVHAALCFLPALIGWVLRGLARAAPPKAPVWMDRSWVRARSQDAFDHETGLALFSNPDAAEGRAYAALAARFWALGSVARTQGSLLAFLGRAWVEGVRRRPYCVPVQVTHGTFKATVRETLMTVGRLPGSFIAPALERETMGLLEPDTLPWPPGGASFGNPKAARLRELGLSEWEARQMAWHLRDFLIWRDHREGRSLAPWELPFQPASRLFERS